MDGEEGEEQRGARQRLMERGTIKGEGGKVAEEAGGTAGGTASLWQQHFRALSKFIYWFSVWAEPNVRVLVCVYEFVCMFVQV